jgi:indole-3-glycerol phosphate synthase
MTILDHILETKRNEVAAAKQRRPITELQAAIARAAPPRDFYAAATSGESSGVRLIAEIKKASPSAGLIVPDFDPVAIARTYSAHGAVALSVLTDETYFQGRLEFIELVKRAVRLPVLRKDFIIDEYQLWESRLAGADAVLLIAAAMPASDLALLAALARAMAMSVLVEVHAPEELETVMNILGDPRKGKYLLGINNRDLHAQRTDLATTTRLAAMLPTGTPFVSESGIATRDDVLRVQRAGACAILVGESLLRANDIGGQIDSLLGRCGEPR